MQSTTHLASQKVQGQDHSFNSTALLSTYNNNKKIQAKSKKGNSYYFYDRTAKSEHSILISWFPKEHKENSLCSQKTTFGRSVNFQQGLEDCVPTLWFPKKVHVISFSCRAYLCQHFKLQSAMLRCSLLVDCTEQQTDFMTDTRKTAFHYYKLQELYCFLCFFALEVFVPCSASGRWKGIWRKCQGKKGGKISER